MNRMHYPACGGAGRANRQRHALRGALAALAVLLGCIPVAREAAALEVSGDFRSAQQQFEAARAGSSAATERARNMFSRLLSGDADNPLYLAYYGSVLCMQGRDSSAPWTKLKLVREGVGVLDRALAALDQRRARVDAAWEDLELQTRLVAIATFIALPEPLFHRTAAAKEQLRLALASPHYPQASNDLQGHLQYEGALIARQEGDVAAERAALLRTLALAPPSVDLAEVRTRLAELH